MVRTRGKKQKRKQDVPNKNILAIDPASLLGWAMSKDEYGVWDLRTRKDESMGMKLIRLQAKLNELKKIKPFDILAYERPAGRHALSIIHQSKLIGIIEKWCVDNSIEYRSYSAAEIKRFATNKGNCGKPAMIAAAQKKLRYIGNDDNEADSLWILALASFELLNIDLREL